MSELVWMTRQEAEEKRWANESRQAGMRLLEAAYDIDPITLTAFAAQIIAERTV